MRKKQPLLSIIIPCYCEEKTIAEAITRAKKVVCDDILKVKITRQVIVVDDGSTDNSWNIIKKFKGITKIHKENGGKGSALKAAIPLCTGRYTIVLDSDLEYFPEEFPIMLYPACLGFKAIIGSRRMNPHNVPNRSSAFSFYLGGNVLTWFGNLLYGLHLTDFWSGFKCIETNLLKELDLQSNGFEICAETVAKLAKKKVSIYEVPITFKARSVEDGKKIRFKDGFRLAWKLVEEKWFRK